MAALFKYPCFVTLVLLGFIAFKSASPLLTNQPGPFGETRACVFVCVCVCLCFSRARKIRTIYTMQRSAANKQQGGVSATPADFNIMLVLTSNLILSKIPLL